MSPFDPFLLALPENVSHRPLRQLPSLRHICVRLSQTFGRIRKVLALFTLHGRHSQFSRYSRMTTSEAIVFALCELETNLVVLSTANLIPSPINKYGVGVRDSQLITVGVQLCLCWRRRWAIATFQFRYAPTNS